MAKQNKPTMRDRLRAQTEQSAKEKSGGGGWSVLDLGEAKTFKPEKGKNLIDIIPFEIHEEFMEKLLSKGGKPLGLRPGGDIAYKLEIPVHRRIGANNRDFLCLSRAFDKKCPICEAAHGMNDEEERKKLQPSWRCVYNVIDLKNEDEGLMVFEASHFLFEKKLITTAEEESNGGEIIVFSDPEDGRTIKFSGAEDSFQGRKHLKFENFAFQERKEAYDPATVSEAWPLDSMLKIPDYAEVSKAFLELDDDDIAPPAEDEPPARKPLRRGAATPPPDDDDDDIPVNVGAEDDDEQAADTDDEPEPTPARKTLRRGAPTKPVAADDDDDDDPAPPAHAPKRGTAAPVSSKQQVSAPVKGKCPAGKRFGIDTDKLDECTDCPNDAYAACAKAKAAAKK